MTTRKIVISGCDKSGIMVEPWADAGYKCFCIDIRHEPGITNKNNIFYVGADITDWLPPREQVAFASFFPPCTDVAVSGARWFKDKGLGQLVDSLKIFYACIKLAEWCNAPYIIENPVSTISTYWRKPDYTFDPYQYAGYRGGQDDLYTKKTCPWTGGGFIMPKAQPLKPVQGSKIIKLPVSENRAEIRSLTPKGFAQAVFEANSPFQRRGCPRRAKPLY